MPAFFFQHPAAGLLALLGLAIPVAIYLWNRRPGRVVQVGSLRWLEAAANRRLRSLKPEGLLLLLVRMGILGLLALAVAGPTWPGQPAPRRGQILLSPDASVDALSSLRPSLDSLLRQGYELRELHPGLPLVAPEARAARLAGQAPAASIGLDSAAAKLRQAPGNVWAQVQQAADSFPNRPLVVVAPLLLRSFRGTRPALPATVSWRPLPAAADSVVQLAAAWQTRPDSLLLLVAYSSETGTAFRRMRLARPSSGAVLRVLPAPAEVRYVQTADQAMLQVKSPTSTTTLPVQTAPSRFWISYDQAHTADMRVLTAALKAAGSVLPVAPHLTISTGIPAPAEQVDWVMWLKTAPVPAELQQRVRQGLQLWQEAATPEAAEATSLSFGVGAPLRISRRDTVPVPAAGWVLWPDAQGRPVLSVQPRGKGRVYHLHTRLTPPWSELADSPELPALLLPYLWPTRTSEAAVADLRALDPNQLTAQPTSAADSTRLPTSQAASATDRGLVPDYTPWLVLAAGLLFGLERWLAARRTAHSSPASA